MWRIQARRRRDLGRTAACQRRCMACLCGLCLSPGMRQPRPRRRHHRKTQSSGKTGFPDPAQCRGDDAASQAPRPLLAVYAAAMCAAWRPQQPGTGIGSSCGAADCGTRQECPPGLRISLDPATSRYFGSGYPRIAALFVYEVGKNQNRQQQYRNFVEDLKEQVADNITAPVELTTSYFSLRHNGENRNITGLIHSSQTDLASKLKSACLDIGLE